MRKFWLENSNQMARAISMESFRKHWLVFEGVQLFYPFLLVWVYSVADCWPTKFYIFMFYGLAGHFASSPRIASGRPVLSFIDTLMDVGAIPVSELSACMNNRTNWVASLAEAAWMNEWKNEWINDLYKWWAPQVYSVSPPLPPGFLRVISGLRLARAYLFVFDTIKTPFMHAFSVFYFRKTFLGLLCNLG